MELTNIPEFKCKKCLKNFEIEIDDFETDTYSYERSMGNENQYNWNYIGNCPHCDNDLEISFDAYEYPVGMLNYEDSELTGCEFIIKPIFNVHNEDFETDI
ncbi:hypothetical protein [Flavobacterium aquicola]|jgi:hypothetical protein|uniref:Uncharacterized protein n=1 Tax=Flavobacterium aquicola TaxID=1682742 RepID=A0A3E0DYT3_9FLAO|nr:hypothetical protein [Flavobacterium aquicola]REG91111.1 hypothetical protein C8P67_1174 [Flavobacterium aquicola]